jgi:type IX secretion system PorP/SprF family membrane protein
MKKQRIIAIVVLMMLFATAKGQDPNFSLFSNNPLYYNPATPGMSNGMDFRLNYRNQWPGLAGRFDAYKFESEYLFSPIFTGLGLMAMSNTEGESFIRTTQFGLSISPYVNLGRNTVLSFGLMSYMAEKRIDWSSLEFDDEYHKIHGKVNPTSFPFPGSEQVKYADFSSGILFRHSIRNKSKDRGSFLNIGFAAHHITKPNHSLIGTDLPLEPKFVFHSNYLIAKYGRTNSAVSPGFIYERQTLMETFTIGANLLKGPVYGGFWIRNKNYTFSPDRFDSFIVSVGIIQETYEKNLLKVGYSYDITISRLMGGTYGSHEIYLSYELQKDVIASMFQGKRFNRRYLKKIQECPPGFEY